MVGKTCEYVAMADKVGWIDKIVIMSERNCRFVLDCLLESIK
jgi:hypothetical protein